MIRMFTTCVGSPRLPFDPLPDLGGVFSAIGVNNEVFKNEIWQPLAQFYVGLT